MATRKQRRRREKEQRHDYEIVYLDHEGNEVEPDESDIRGPATRNGSAKPRSAKSSSGSARRGRGRVPQEPSWRRVAKRGAIFAPLFLAAILLLSRGKLTIAGAILQTVILMALFVPFSYFLDSLMWRSYQKKAAGQSGAKR